MARSFFPPDLCSLKYNSSIFFAFYMQNDGLDTLFIIINNSVTLFFSKLVPSFVSLRTEKRGRKVTTQDYPGHILISWRHGKVRVSHSWAGRSLPRIESRQKYQWSFRIKSWCVSTLKFNINSWIMYKPHHTWNRYKNRRSCSEKQNANAERGG